MKFQKTINLTSYMVEYIDKRQPKPRTIRRELVVLDGGRVDAMQRLGMRPAGYIAQQFERDGYTVTDVRNTPCAGGFVRPVEPDRAGHRAGADTGPAAGSSGKTGR